MDPQFNSERQQSEPFKIEDISYTPSSEELERRIFGACIGLNYSEENANQLIQRLPQLLLSPKCCDIALEIIRISGKTKTSFDTCLKLLELAIPKKDSCEPLINLILLASKNFCFSSFVKGLLDTSDPEGFLSAFNEIPTTIKLLGRETIPRQALLDLCSATDIKRALEVIRVYQYDDPPYAPNDIENIQRTRREVFKVFRGAIDLSYGFEALKVEAKKIPFIDHSLQELFGIAHAKATYNLNSISSEEYPGNGVVYSGFKIEEFLPGTEKTSSTMPPEYLESIPWAADVFMDFARFQIAEVRAGIILKGPEKYEYTLDNIPYVMIIYNEHFLNPFKIMSLLVPSELVWPQISEAMIPIDTFRGFDTNQPKINGNLLNPISLYAEAKKRGLNILNLGSLSNLAGLANAYPRGSEPYFSWEKELDTTRTGWGFSTDIAGHYHKSHMNGRLIEVMSPTFEKQLIAFRNAHNYVYQIANRFFCAYDLLRLFRSFWHKGITSTGNERHKFETDQDEVDQNDRQIEMLPAETRMLEFAYKWHHEQKDKAKNISDRYLLAIAPTFNYSNAVKSSIILDIRDMTLKTPDKEIYFPRNTDGTGSLEKGLWALHVRPHLGSIARDLRFFDANWQGLSLG